MLLYHTYIVVTELPFENLKSSCDRLHQMSSARNHRRKSSLSRNRLYPASTKTNDNLFGLSVRGTRRVYIEPCNWVVLLSSFTFFGYASLNGKRRKGKENQATKSKSIIFGLYSAFALECSFFMYVLIMELWFQLNRYMPHTMYRYPDTIFWVRVLIFVAECWSFVD